jgi:hypothetical protein
LPAVRIIFVWRRPGADGLAAGYAREREPGIGFAADRSEEILDNARSTAVVFGAGGKESAELLRAARQIPLRVVDVRRFVQPARS